MDKAIIQRIHKEVGKIFYELRVSNGYTITALSRELGITTPTISSKEKGSIRISLMDILIYATFFNLHPSDIVSMAEQRALERNT